MKQIIIVLSLLVLMLFVSCSTQNEQEKDSLINETSVFNPDKEVGFSYQSYCVENGGTWNEVANDCEGISKEVCEAKEGTFNECASACRGTDSEICTLQCVMTCEFNGNLDLENEIDSNEKLVDSYGNEVSSFCSVWSDGCNTCQVTENGLACTKKFCSVESLEKATCLEFEENLPQDFVPNGKYGLNESECKDLDGTYSFDGNGIRVCLT